MKIAMWSGPRNLSTAMMYSFAARSDCAVWDEPFYAAYLHVTGADHPMRERVLQRHETDKDRVADRISQAIPDGKAIWYMKHMPHHMVDGMPLDWARDCVNVHLIRHPARVIASYGQKRDSITMDDIGYVRQTQIYAALGGLVIDSFDIRKNPARALQKLCEAIDIPWDNSMLQWPSGGHPEDGAWAPHWYNAVHASTGFAGAEGALPPVPKQHRSLFEDALPHYDAMKAVALQV